MNNNNKYNSLYGRPLLDFQGVDSDHQYPFVPFWFRSLFYTAYYTCRKNKRKTPSALRFELNYESSLDRLARDVYYCEYVPRSSIAFIVTVPKIREIEAADFSDRIVQHVYFARLSPLVEKHLNSSSYSCRVGMGALAAVTDAHDYIAQVSEGYTKDCWIAKFDLQSFFMSIDKNKLASMLVEFIKVNYEGPDKDILIYLTRVIYQLMPSENAIRKSPLPMWNDLPSEKSLFAIAWNLGLAIGNITTQLAANFFTTPYLNYVNELGFNCMCNYTDDLLLVVPDKDEFLRKIPYVREFLKNELGLKLHPYKFYFQHYSKPVHFLGYVIKKERVYVDNRTKDKMFEKVRLNTLWADQDDKFVYRNAEAFSQTLNSYLGLLSHCYSYKIRADLAGRVMQTKWNRVLSFSEGYTKCIVKKGYTKRDQAMKRIQRQKQQIKYYYDNTRTDQFS
jgi:RNA-directed DNA polymerase